MQHKSPNSSFAFPQVNLNSQGQIEKPVQVSLARSSSPNAT